MYTLPFAISGFSFPSERRELQFAASEGIFAFFLLFFFAFLTGRNASSLREIFSTEFLANNKVFLKELIKSFLKELLRLQAYQFPLYRLSPMWLIVDNSSRGYKKDVSGDF